MSVEIKDGATVLVVVSECGTERVLQMTEAEAESLRDTLDSLLFEDEDLT